MMREREELSKPERGLAGWVDGGGDVIDKVPGLGSLSIPRKVG